MNKMYAMACVSLLSAVAACAPAGYYDSNGEYRSYGKSDSFRHDKPVAGTPTTTTYVDDEEPGTTTVIYKRPGYYDRNGYYISRANGPRVTEDYFPPRGMCRVWFTNRALSDEPPVESCVGIQTRVPSGAYVIYGGGAY